MRDCHSIVGLYTYQNRVPFAPSLRWVSCKERDRLPHEGANFHSSFVHYRIMHQPEKLTKEGALESRMNRTATVSQDHHRPKTSTAGCPGTNTNRSDGR